MTNKLLCGRLGKSVYFHLPDNTVSICDLTLYYDSGGGRAASIRAVSQGWGGWLSLWAEARQDGS